MTAGESVWVFHGSNARFAAGVFHSEADGRRWIESHGLSGILTEYPLGDGCYDVAVREGLFRPKKEHERMPAFVASFSPRTRHFHFTDGRPD